MSKVKGTAIIKLKLDDAELNRGLKAAQDNFKRLGANIAKAGLSLVAIGGAGIAGFFATAKAAGDAQEIISRFNAVFRDQAGGAREFAKILANDVGRAETDILDALSSYQAFFVGLGKGSAESAKLSKELTALAIDFASFNNITDGDAQRRFISALAGSSEVVDKYGINLKKAALDNFFLSNGIDATTATATEQQKVMARLAIITESMGSQGAVGDAIRTSDSFNNSMKRLNGEMKTLKETIGKGVIGSFTELVSLLTLLVKTAKLYTSENQDTVKALLAGATATVALGLALTVLGTAFVAIGGAAGVAISILASWPLILATITSAFVTLKAVVGSALITLGSPFITVALLLSIVAAGIVRVSGSFDGLVDKVGGDLKKAFDGASDSYAAFSAAIKAGDLEKAFDAVVLGLELAFLTSFDSILVAWEDFKTVWIVAMTEIRTTGESAFLSIKTSALSAMLDMAKASSGWVDSFVEGFKVLLFEAERVFIKLKNLALNAALEIALISPEERIDRQEINDESARLEVAQLELDDAKRQITQGFISPLIEAISKTLGEDLGRLEDIESGKVIDDLIDSLLDLDQSSAKARQSAIELIKAQLQAIEANAIKKSTSEDDAEKEDILAGIKTPKQVNFGQLAEAGSSAALKLLAGNDSPLVGLQKKANKTLELIQKQTNFAVG